MTARDGDAVEPWVGHARSRGLRRARAASAGPRAVWRAGSAAGDLARVTPVLQLTGIQKRYQSLRPLRLQELTIASGERVAVSGFDAGAAEVLVNLVTGASLPDQGDVRVLGQLTVRHLRWRRMARLPRSLRHRQPARRAARGRDHRAEPGDAADAADRSGTAGRGGSRRGAGAGVRDRGRRRRPRWLQRVTGEAPPHIRARVHLARAVALAPALLVLEHPGADSRGRTRARRSRTASPWSPTRGHSPRS